MRPRSLYKNSIQLIGIVFAMLLGANTAFAQPTSFTYQGRLTDSGTAANGNYDLQFALFDSLAGGAQIATQTVPNVSVSAGIFTVTLDFGANAFPGAPRFLEIGARLTGTPSFTTLAPRQPITSTPYAIRSLNASTADAVTAGGTLTGNIVNAATQFNLGSSRVLGLGPNTGTNNFLVGLNAGNALIDGRENTFIGSGAGQATTGGPQDCASCGPGGTPLYKGSHNTFVGYRAGNGNTTGGYNSFFGASAGATSTTANNNSFFGSFAGVRTTVSNNSFFGSFAGYNNTTGLSNAYFGNNAGINNTVGSQNSIFGSFAGSQNTGSENSLFGSAAGSQTTGGENTFFGSNTGGSNGQGSKNTLIGVRADVGSSSLTNATAIGANARVDQGDSLVLGRDVNVGIGTTTPQSRLHVVGSSWFQGDNTPLPSNAGKGIVMGFAGEQGYISAFDYAAFTGKNLLLNNSGGNVGIGTTTPTAKLTVSGAGAFNSAGAVRFDLHNTVASTGFLQHVTDSGLWQIATTTGATRMVIDPSGAVGIGTTAPFLNTKLDIVGGFLRLDQLAGGGDENLCRNSTAHTITTCSSSLRYKEQIAPYSAGLELINRLRPISFAWKANGTRDLGLGAEDVAKVEPLLVTHNDKGEIEGVRYDRLTAVLINAVKEQQAQIENQQSQIATLRTGNAVLSARLRAVETTLKRRASSARRRR